MRITHTKHSMDSLKTRLDEGYRPGYLPQEFATRLYQYLAPLCPDMVHYRSQGVSTRPKINFVIGEGGLPLYKWGQHAGDYTKLTEAPPIIRELVDMVTADFKVPSDEVPNHCIATFYFNGSEQAIPCHQDKTFSVKSTDPKVENGTTVFNLSVGAERTFHIVEKTSVAKGAIRAKDFDTVAKYPMGHGDLYALTGGVNEEFGHGIPYEPEVTDLRVSLVLRSSTLWSVDPATRVCVNNKTGRTTVAVTKRQQEHESTAHNVRKRQRIAASSARAAARAAEWIEGNLRRGSAERVGA
jgi:alkylated DNA repair dioxygenase AlkB